ncbi:MAG TPA: PKD domain-containing protein [Methanocorpusculum sp.]|nr:PKD domain-containing protein [Methanocorpusculum sp.]HJK79958.1 PKD domain-containing protein [Methanocorpusculum sp.]
MKKYLIPLILLLAAALFAFPAAAAITADFSYSVDSSNPLTIHFTDKSTGGAGNWFWMFNDGGNAVSNERNPTYTFSSEGTYQIYLAVTDANYNGEDTVRKWITISRSGITEDSDSSSPGSSSSGGSSSGGSSGGGISFPDISLGGISIPNPLDLIDEYIKLLRVMVIPGNYNF